LKLTYKAPTERIDGRAVIKNDGTPVFIADASSLENTFVEEAPLPEVKKEASPMAKIEIKKTRKIRIPKKKMNEKEEEKQEKEVPPGESNTHIEEFKSKGISILEHLTEQQLSAMLLESNTVYYNTKTALMTDNQYDILKEYIERKYPKNQAITKVGAPVEKNKAKLPYEMASMDKIKPDSNALPNWVKKYKGPYLLSCKLDGVSGMYSTEGQVPKLYTRGDGKVGQDVSHLIPLLKLPNHKNTVVRGEFIIPKKVFEDKYKERFANPRNLVSGIVIAKNTDEKVNDLHFVAYEVIKPSLKPSEQMALLKQLRHEVVMNRQVDELTNESLSARLLDWRKSYEYEIDGVIVTDDKIHPRVSGNPDHAFAFKMVISDQIAEAKVVDVIWNASKDGYLKPRVRIEPIKLGGVTIEYATGFNGKFIEENKIGVGAVIEIIRSGDVIPYIKSVTQPAEKGKMPDVPFKWTDKHVDIMLENIGEDSTVKEKNITAFFVELEVDGLSIGNVKRIMKAGFDSIPKVLRMTKTDYESVEGFKGKMVEKIYNGVKEKVAAADLLTVMKASNMLGRGLGERKLRPMLEHYPNILTSKEAPEEKIKMLRSIDGIGPENAKSFVANIPVFLAFLKECDLEGKLSQNVLRESTPKVNPNVDVSNPLYGKKIVMTKIRDKEIIEYLPKVGATLEDNIKKDTFVLIVKSKADSSNKTKYAEENGISIMEPAEFKSKYMA
jgi:NAD-dependent DNA ligase